MYNGLHHHTNKPEFGVCSNGRVVTKSSFFLLKLSSMIEVKLQRLNALRVGALESIRNTFELFFSECGSICLVHLNK